MFSAFFQKKPVSTHQKPDAEQELNPLSLLGKGLGKVFNRKDVAPDQVPAGPYINPESLTAQKREWIDMQAEGQTDLATWPEHLYEHFFVVGLPPDIEVTQIAQDLVEKERRPRTEEAQSSSAPSAASNGADAGGPQYDKAPKPAYAPQVLFRHPPSKPAPLSDQELVDLCFPHMVTPSKLRRTPSLSALHEVIYNRQSGGRDDAVFIFLLKVGVSLPLYGVCAYVTEMLHRPPHLARAQYPGCKAPFRSCMIAAPRCYCILSHYPFFQLHLQVLSVLVGMERLHRTVEYNNEQEAAGKQALAGMLSGNVIGPVGASIPISPMSALPALAPALASDASGFPCPTSAAIVDASSGGGATSGIGYNGGAPKLPQQCIQQQVPTYCKDCAAVISDIYPGLLMQGTCTPRPRASSAGNAVGGACTSSLPQMMSEPVLHSLPPRPKRASMAIEAAAGPSARARHTRSSAGAAATGSSGGGGPPANCSAQQPSEPTSAAGAALGAVAEAQATGAAADNVDGGSSGGGSAMLPAPPLMGAALWPAVVGERPGCCAVCGRPLVPQVEDVQVVPEQGLLEDMSGALEKTLDKIMSLPRAVATSVNEAAAATAQALKLESLRRISNDSVLSSDMGTPQGPADPLPPSSSAQGLAAKAASKVKNTLTSIPRALGDALALPRPPIGRRRAAAFSDGGAGAAAADARRGGNSMDVFGTDSGVVVLAGAENASPMQHAFKGPAGAPAAPVVGATNAAGGTLVSMPAQRASAVASPFSSFAFSNAVGSPGGSGPLPPGPVAGPASYAAGAVNVSELTHEMSVVQQMMIEAGLVPGESGIARAPSPPLRHMRSRANGLLGSGGSHGGSPTVKGHGGSIASPRTGYSSSAGGAASGCSVLATSPGGVRDAPAPSPLTISAQRKLSGGGARSSSGGGAAPAGHALSNGGVPGAAPGPNELPRQYRTPFADIGAAMSSIASLGGSSDAASALHSTGPSRRGTGGGAAISNGGAAPVAADLCAGTSGMAQPAATPVTAPAAMTAASNDSPGLDAQRRRTASALDGSMGRCHSDTSFYSAVGDDTSMPAGSGTPGTPAAARLDAADSGEAPLVPRSAAGSVTGSPLAARRPAGALDLDLSMVPLGLPSPPIAVQASAAQGAQEGGGPMDAAAAATGGVALHHSPGQLTGRPSRFAPAPAGSKAIADASMAAVSTAQATGPPTPAASTALAATPSADSHLTAAGNGDDASALSPKRPSQQDAAAAEPSSAVAELVSPVIAQGPAVALPPGPSSAAIVGGRASICAAPVSGALQSGLGSEGMPSVFSPARALDELYAYPIIHLNPGEQLVLRFGVSALQYQRPTLQRRCPVVGSPRQIMDYANAELAEGLGPWTTAAMCRALSLDNILLLLTAMLLERQLVFFCPNIGLLSALVLGVLPLLRPFAWHGLLLPVTPTSMMGFLDAPVPFVLGVQYKTADVMARCANLVRVNVYKDQVKNAGAPLPQLPGVKKLAAALAPLHATLRAGPGGAAGVNGDWRGDSRPLRVLSPEEAEASDAFLKLLRSHLTAIVGDLRPHTITNVGMDKRTGVLMKESLLESVAPRDRLFVKTLMETQAFSVWSDAQIGAQAEGSVYTLEG